jgi:hypothetical protein
MTKEKLELLLLKNKYYYIDVIYMNVKYESIVYKNKNGEIFILYKNEKNYDTYDHNIDTFFGGFTDYIYQNLDKLTPIPYVIIKNLKNIIISTIDFENGSIEFLDTKIKFFINKNKDKIKYILPNSDYLSDLSEDDIVGMYKIYQEIQKQNYL